MYNGPYGQGTPVSRFCRQDQASHVVTSSGSLMYVVFHASADVTGNTGRGFNATYRSVAGGLFPCQKLSSMRTPVAAVVYFIMFVGCGGNFTAPTAHLTSPDYPDSYPHGAYCVWYLSVREHHSVKLHVNDIHLETSDDCTLDFIQVGPTTANPLASNPHHN